MAISGLQASQPQMLIPNKQLFFRETNKFWIFILIKYSNFWYESKSNLRKEHWVISFRGLNRPNSKDILAHSHRSNRQQDYRANSPTQKRNLGDLHRVSNRSWCKRFFWGLPDQISPRFSFFVQNTLWSYTRFPDRQHIHW